MNDAPPHPTPSTNQEKPANMVELDWPWRLRSGGKDSPVLDWTPSDCLLGCKMAPEAFSRSLPSLPPPPHHHAHANMPAAVARVASRLIGKAGLARRGFPRLAVFARTNSLPSGRRRRVIVLNHKPA